MKSNSLFITVWIALMTLWSVGAFGAEEFAKGTGALEIFDGEAFAAMPLWGQVWLVFLVSTFVVGLIFFAWKQPIARWAAGGFIVSIATGHMVFAALGLPMLSGSIAIWHIVCWTPALVLLLTQRPFLNPNEGRWYRIWSGVMTCAILFSFVFDVRDAVIYIDHFSRP